MCYIYTYIYIPMYAYIVLCKYIHICMYIWVCAEAVPAGCATMFRMLVTVRFTWEERERERERERVRVRERERANGKGGGFRVSPPHGYPQTNWSQSASPGDIRRVGWLNGFGGTPREQKMLKGHLPRVIFHHVYKYTEMKDTEKLTCARAARRTMRFSKPQKSVGTWSNVCQKGTKINVIATPG